LSTTLLQLACLLISCGGMLENANVEKLEACKSIVFCKLNKSIVVCESRKSMVVCMSMLPNRPIFVFHYYLWIVALC